jgi:nucleotide-binding universal stress UspA family protein
MRIRTILHPTDYSELSQTAFAYATEIARSQGARITVLHVAETLGPDHLTYGEAISQPQPESYRRRLWEEFLRLTPGEPSVPLEHLLREGDPAEEIIRAAREFSFDLVVMGTHWRHGWRRWLEGSVAEAVLRAVSCPILVVKTDEHPQAPPEMHAAAPAVAK